MAKSEGISLKKYHGQNFLRNQGVVTRIVDRVLMTPETSVFEIGCGDGFLTKEILTRPCARLWVFEIDSDWADYVTQNIQDPRLKVHLENVLDVDFSTFEPYQPWTLLANLPYHVTFPILHMLQRNRHLLKEGVIMVQEEVAQKLLKTSGKGYGYPSLFFNRYFEWQLMEKVLPGSFFPPPKVNSRLLYFKPRQDVAEIPNEKGFWKFIKMAFKQPRRTFKNNLMQSHIDPSNFPEEILALRAQQMKMEDFLNFWTHIKAHYVDRSESTKNESEEDE